MRILYIITQADGGGAQKYVLALAKYFGGSIAAGTEDTRLFEDAKALGIETFPLKHLKRKIAPLQDFLAAWEIRELIETFQPDIVHLNSSKAGVLGSFAAVGLKKKVVFTAHGFIFNEPLNFAVKSFYLALEKVASDFRNFIITVSDADRQSAINHRLIAENKIATIHNGLPIINFLPKNEARVKLNLPLNKFIFGTVANFYKTKGLDILIKAIANMDKADLDKALFVIVGSGRLERELKSLISKSSLQKNILLIGQVPNADRLIKTFDCFVLPSRKEGFSFTLLEAMQAGLPIIATNVGGNKEAVGDVCRLIEAENILQLTEALQNILNASPNELALMSQKSLKRSELFTEGKMLEKTEQVYKKLTE